LVDLLVSAVLTIEKHSNYKLIMQELDAGQAPSFSSSEPVFLPGREANCPKMRTKNSKGGWG